MVQFDKDIDFDSDEMYMFHQLDKIEKFDNARIGSAVKKALDWDKAGIIVVKPNKKGLKGDTRAKVKFEVRAIRRSRTSAIDPREAKRPLKVAAELKSLAGAERFTLGNGMKVVLLPVKSMPLATAQLVFQQRRRREHAGQPSRSRRSAAGFLQRVPDMDPNMQQNTDVFSRTGIEIDCGSATTRCSAVRTASTSTSTSWSRASSA